MPVVTDASRPPGHLVCIGGPPGAGKSTVGALVAASGGLSLVDLDSVTTALVEAFASSLGLEADLDAPRFAGLRAARYACLGRVVRDNLVAGRDVVAVAPFTAEGSDAGAWRGLAESWGAASVVLCWLDLDLGEAGRRVAARGLPRDLAKRGRPPGPPGGAVVNHRVDRGGLDLVVDGRAPAVAIAAQVLAASRTSP